MSGNAFERVVTPIPGPNSARQLVELRRFESRNVTAVHDDFPIVWESARGANVLDADGNRYLDLTAAFGVANAGHANPRVVAAIADQAARLMHGMGDVHPTAVRVRLLERLCGMLPGERWKAFLATTGSEAVEAALKTAMLATGRSHVAAYRNAYHGLSLGTLPLCGIEKFRTPFAGALGPPAVLLDFPDASTGIAASAAIAQTRTTLRTAERIAAIVVEPVQGRAGCIVPPDGYLRELRALCDQLGALLIVDEIFTGFGRTGTLFAVQREDVLPDILCVGKALGSGFPISAAIGRSGVMDAWPLSTGEALHTSTYLGNPMGCAAALATCDEIERLRLPQRAAGLEPLLAQRLSAMRAHPSVRAVRGRGMFWGLHVRDARVTDGVTRAALAAGAIVLPSGPHGDVITISPPLTIGRRQLARGLDLLEAAVAAVE